MRPRAARARPTRKRRRRPFRIRNGRRVVELGERQFVFDGAFAAGAEAGAPGEGEAAEAGAGAAAEA
ncbi:hypothetical protein, partial [Burkholderia thailandensis]